jgi:1,4-alpha-glucan branching enzyme
MLYYDHGLGRDFTSYDCYFDGGQDGDAITYLGLANILVKELNPNAFTIAEDMSGLPGLAAPIAEGGIGFDYRMSMGVADHWIKWIKERSDWDWSMGEIWHELSGKRPDERTISYAECHDQALVGDKTIIFRLIDQEMYWSMNRGSQNLVIDRGVALHKLIRLVTLATAGDGYLTFMGNEFGHPEWIDFPREGNDWSFFYARRQWSLVDNPQLRYHDLWSFEQAMLHMATENALLGAPVHCLRCDEEKKVLLLERAGLVFAFNFNPEFSFDRYGFAVPGGSYAMVLDSDAPSFGGFSRNDDQVAHMTVREGEQDTLYLYLPSRTVQVLKKI